MSKNVKLLGQQKTRLRKESKFEEEALVDLLWIARAGMYGTVALFPYIFSDIIVVPYDATGHLLFFVCIPFALVWAHWGQRILKTWLSLTWRQEIGVQFVFPLALAFIFRESSQWYLFCLSSWFSYWSTKLLFSRRSGVRPWQGWFATIEIFATGWVSFQLLNFSRTQLDTSEWIVRTLLFFLVFGFLAHAWILQRALVLSSQVRSEKRNLRSSKNRLLSLFTSFSFSWRRMFVCGVILIVGAFVLSLIPLDSVKHQAFFNNLLEDPPVQNLENGQGNGRSQPQQNNGRNGLPLGEHEEKYPSEFQKGGKSERETQPPGNQEEAQPGPGNGQRNQEEAQPRQGKRPRLEGIPRENWKTPSQQNQGEESQSQLPDKQFSVMIVQARVNPLYLAEEYWGEWGAQGFEATPKHLEPLNRLSSLRMIDVWEAAIDDTDEKRAVTEIFVLSSLENRVLSYRPFRVEPTVQNLPYYPFSLSYQSHSRISYSVPSDWAKLAPASHLPGDDLDSSSSFSSSPRVSNEAADGSYYLQLPEALRKNETLREKYLRVLQVQRKVVAKLPSPESSNSEAVKSEKNTPTNGQRFSSWEAASRLPVHEKIDTILQSFSQFQYALGFNQTLSLNGITGFFTQNKTGKCTEFAAGATILARMMDLPARMVVGYIASRDLQTETHRQALAHLQGKLKPLQKFPLDQLFLVTTLHHHAWLQVYVPKYGWIDLEATAFAKPPPLGENPNELDLVIPLIEEEGYVLANPEYVFPWRPFLTLLAIFFAFTMMGLYGYRYGQQTIYALRGMKSRPEGYHYRYRSFLLRQAYDGYPIREAYQTPAQYAKNLILSESLLSSSDKILHRLAHLYTKLYLQRGWSVEDSREVAMDEFYTAIATAEKKMRRPGVWAWFGRVLRLRGLGVK